MPRPIATPQNARSRRTRAALLDAAWRLIEEKGAEELSMTAVARRAGVTRAAIYLHFASRGELLLALFKHVNTSHGLAASLRPLRDAPDGLAALDAWAQHLARFHTRILPLMRAVERARGEDPDSAVLWRRVTGDRYAGCQALAARLAAEGRLADPWTAETAAELLWALMSAELLEGLSVHRGWTPEQLAERLALVARRALA
jgi:AcrR family transcriptional regulator